MGKEYYCSDCGTPLIHNRRGLANKQKIVDLIDPHECDASNKSNIEDSKAPVRTIAEADIEDLEERVSRTLHPGEEYIADRRGKEHQRKSSAPRTLLEQVIKGSNTNPENEFRDLEKAVDND